MGENTENEKYERVLLANEEDIDEVFKVTISTDGLSAEKAKELKDAFENFSEDASALSIGDTFDTIQSVKAGALNGRPMIRIIDVKGKVVYLSQLSKRKKIRGYIEPIKENNKIVGGNPATEAKFLQDHADWNTCPFPNYLALAKAGKDAIKGLKVADIAEYQYKGQDGSEYTGRLIKWEKTEN